MKLSNVKKVLEKLNVMLHLDDVTLSLAEVSEAIGDVVTIRDDSLQSPSVSCGITWWAAKVYFRAGSIIVMHPKRTEKEANEEGNEFLDLLDVRGFNVIEFREVKK